MDHGSLVPDGHAAADGEGAREELDDERLHLEDVLDPRPVEEPDDLGDAGPGGRGLRENVACWREFQGKDGVVFATDRQAGPTRYFDRSTLELEASLVWVGIQIIPEKFF